MGKKTKTRRTIHHRRRRTAGNGRHSAEAHNRECTTEAAIGLIEVALEYLKRAIQSE